MNRLFCNHDGATYLSNDQVFLGAVDCSDLAPDTISGYAMHRWRSTVVCCTRTAVHSPVLIRAAAFLAHQVSKCAPK